MGRVGPDSAALLDGALPRAHRPRPYDHPPYHRAERTVNQAVKQGATRAAVQPGSVTFVQRFGGSINAHVHFHVVFLEGVFRWLIAPPSASSRGSSARRPPTDTDIATVLQTISRRVIRQLRKLGYLEVDTEDAVPTGYDPASDEDPELARTLAASVQQRIAFGERAGQRVRRIGWGFGYEGEISILTGTRCASVNGFSLHANTHVPAHRRDQLERLLRYTGRGAVSLERLEVNADGDLLYTFTHPWSDGTTGITLSPMELLEKLVALVPLPRQHLLRYGGCLAPHSHLRAAIIPTHASKGWKRPTTRARRRTGRGHGCSSASSRLIWNAARCVSRDVVRKELP